jgi:hypothetical protein
MMNAKPYVFFFFLLFIGFFSSSANASVYQLEYTITVHADGSATWIIEYFFREGQNEAFFSEVSDYRYFTDVFIRNVKTLVNLAKEETNRVNMTVKKFVMKVSEDPYKVVQYRFYWREFAELEDASIKIGDVFEVEGLFLEGDGKVNIVYPSGYVVESVSPQPDVESSRRLTWYGTAYFKTGEPRIVLQRRTALGFAEIIEKNASAIVSAIVLVGVGSTSIYLYLFKLRKKEIRKQRTIGVPFSIEACGIEDDEEKIINLLKTAGGSLYQSKIADRCGFSRSKTSKLLKAMEESGKIRREVKGREKVVTLIEQIEGSGKTKPKERT